MGLQTDHKDKLFVKTDFPCKKWWTLDFWTNWRIKKSVVDPTPVKNVHSILTPSLISSCQIFALASYLVCNLGNRAKPDLAVGYLVNFDLCHSATVILTYSVRITMTRRFDFDKHTVFNKIIYTPYVLYVVYLYWRASILS